MFVRGWCWSVGNDAYYENKDKTKTKTYQSGVEPPALQKTPTRGASEESENTKSVSFADALQNKNRTTIRFAFQVPRTTSPIRFGQPSPWISLATIPPSSLFSSLKILPSSPPEEL